MQRSRAPYWVVDALALLGVFVLCFVGKLATDTTVVIVLAILGFGGIARRHATAAGELPVSNEEEPSGPQELAPVAVRARVPAPPRLKLPSSGGLATFLVGMTSLLHSIVSGRT